MMKNNPENIPSHLFDWLENTPFSRLGPEQQKEVLLYLSEEEYEDMHLSATELKQFAAQHAEGRNKKALIMDRFDRHHSPGGKTAFFNRQVPLWQAAALFLLLAGAWQFFSSRNTPEKEPVLAGITDTVFVASLPELVKITDTIYLEKSGNSNNSSHRQHVSAVSGSSPGKISNVPAELGTVSIKSINELPNRQKKNSLREDTLLKKYSIAAL